VSITPEQLAAYRNARYVVFSEPDLVLRIGEPNADLDELLEAEGATSAAFISASNPRGELQSDGVNDIAYVALVQVESEGYEVFAGEGRDPQGKWPAERSALILGIAREEAERIGRAFEQNAIVFVEKGAAPELIVLSA
jgi:hypothetical protein